MFSESDLKIRVRQVVNEVKNRLSSSKEPLELCQELQRLIHLLPARTKSASSLTRLAKDLTSFKTELTRSEDNQSRLTPDDSCHGPDSPKSCSHSPGIPSNSSVLSTGITRLAEEDPSDSHLLTSESTDSKPDSTSFKSDQTGFIKHRSPSIDDSTESARNSSGLSASGLKTASHLSDFSDADLPRASAEFCTHHYVRFLENLVNLLSLDWCGRFGVHQRKDFIDVFFFEGVPQDAFMVLSSAVLQSSPSFKQNKCLSLLEDFLTHHHLMSMMWKQCTVSSGIHDKSSDSQAARQKMQWDQLINMMVTLPDRMANKMQHKCRELFYPKAYFTMLGREIMSVLYKVHAQLSATKDCSLLFVSLLMGRVCLSGNADTLFQVLLPHFAKLTKEDFIWSRVCSRLIVGAPVRSLESIIHCLVQHVPWYGVMSRLLGDAVVSNKQLEYLLTNKFLLHRYYQQDTIPQNIIGYLSDAPNRRHLLTKTLKTVLDVWGDGSAVKHTSYDQQIYLTKVLLICIGHLTDKEKKTSKSELMFKLMPGVQSHIGSPISNVRRLGMLVAEAMTMTLDPDGPKLSFEYEKDREIEGWLGLLVPPEDPGIESLTKDLEDVAVDVTESSSPFVMETDSSHGDPKDVQQHGDDLDSDDDLEPYDMTIDPKVTQIRTPMYVRDCMEGLLSKDNPDLFETSLKVCEKLIRANPDDLQDVCVEFMRIMLHMENNYDTDGYVKLRHGSMVSLTVQCPVQVAQQLTTEFYDRNYSIRHRLDILEVLAGAAQELSQPIDSSASKLENVSLVSSPVSIDLPSSESWRDIVQKRIETKTRRFVKGASKPSPTAVANRFAPVAGYFFFPLMKQYDSRMNTMDMLGEDFLLLGRMMYTLGVVIHAAQNTMICRQMARNLLEFIWVLRYHTESFVRQSLLFCVPMVILSVPSHLLVSDLQDDLLECKFWIEDIVEKDPDTDCKKLAAQTLVLMQTSVKKELDLQPDDST